MKIESLKKWLLALGGTALLSTSCEKTSEEPDITANNLKGMFVVCEGVFGKADGDISFYNPESDQTTKNLFYTANGVAVGDVVQSFEIVDTLGFIAVNNSQRVTIVNMKDFKVVKSINGFSYPRNIVRADKNTVYVSNGNGYSGNYIYSIDLSSLEITDSLELSGGPEKMIAVNSKIFTAIAGGWKNDGNAVVEIDPLTFTIANTYTVASVPVDLAADIDRNIWVYCKGTADYSNFPAVSYTNSGISKIIVSSKTVTTFPFTNMSSPGINNIAASKDGRKIFYLNDGLYSMLASANGLPETKVINQIFYGFDVDPQSGEIVCLDASGSKADIYNETGVKQKSFETSSFPNSVVFSK